MARDNATGARRGGGGLGNREGVANLAMWNVAGPPQQPGVLGRQAEETSAVLAVNGGMPKGILRLQTRTEDALPAQPRTLRAAVRLGSPHSRHVRIGPPLDRKSTQ